MLLPDFLPRFGLGPGFPLPFCRNLLQLTFQPDHFLQFGKQDFVLRAVRNLVDVDVTDDAVLVENKDRPFREPLLPFHAVFFCHSSQGAKVAQEGK